jgi:hypothetical protein
MEFVLILIGDLFCYYKGRDFIDNEQEKNIFGYLYNYIDYLNYYWKLYKNE